MTYYLVEIRGLKGTRGWKPYQVVDHCDDAIALAKTINAQGYRSRIELVRGLGAPPLPLKGEQLGAP